MLTQEELVVSRDPTRAPRQGEAMTTTPARTYRDMPVVNCGTDVSHMAHVYPVNGVKTVCNGVLPHSVPLDAERQVEQAYEVSQVHEDNQRLAGELAKTRAELDRLRATNGCPSCAAGSCDEHIHLSSAHIGDLAYDLAEARRSLRAVRTVCEADHFTQCAKDVLRLIPPRLVADANPATTAEPADDELVPHVEHVSAETIAGMAAMSQVRNPEASAPWDDDEAADEPWRDFTIHTDWGNEQDVYVACRLDDVCEEVKHNPDGTLLTLGEAVDWAKEHTTSPFHAEPADEPKDDPYPLVPQDFRDAVAKTAAERWPDKYGTALPDDDPAYHYDLTAPQHNVVAE